MYMPLLVQEYINDNIFAVVSSPEVFVINNFSKIAKEPLGITKLFGSNIYVGMSISLWKGVMKYCGRDINEMILADYNTYRTGFDFSNDEDIFDVAEEFYDEVRIGKINEYSETHNVTPVIISCDEDEPDDIDLAPEFNIDFSKYYPNANWSWVSEYNESFKKFMIENIVA
jgi:hypothetical protein